MAHAWLHQILDWMRFIQAAGTPGWILFVGLYALCRLLFIPGSLLSIAAGAIYGFWGGSLLVLAGNGVGSLLNLLIARYFLHDWIGGWVKRHPQVKALENAVTRDDIRLVFLTRLSPVMPFSLINYSLGLTNISV